MSSDSHGWRHALRSTPRPIRAVALLYFAPFITLLPDLTGPLDWTWFGHPVAGERYLYIPGFALWSWLIWLAGRRSDPEMRRWWAATIWCGFAAATAWISYERGSGGWLIYQTSLGVAQLFIALQLIAWARVAHIERGGVLILAICATVELAIFVAVQFIGWDKGCVYGLGLTCLDGPWVTLAPAMATIVALVLWIGWLARKLGRGRD